MSSQVHHATLIHHATIARETEQFIFELKEPLHFLPGQFISVQVGLDDQQNPILRSYSLASSASKSDQFHLVLRMVNPGVGSQFFRNLSIGETIRVTGPFGFFVNEDHHPGDVVYVATGTGIAPFYPMIQQTLERTTSGKVFLFWGMRHPEDIFWQDELAELKRQYPQLEFHFYVSQPPQGYNGKIGRVTQPVLELATKIETPVFYLCGSGSMIRELKTALQDLGINRKRQIRTEPFFD